MKSFKLSCFLLGVFVTDLSYAGVIADLEKYGNSVANSTDGSITFVSEKQTTKSPMNAYKLTFRTDHEALMSVPGASSGNAAYLTNVGRTKAWSIKFCTDKLKRIMSRYKLDLVTGDLTNLESKTQSMSIC